MGDRNEGKLSKWGEKRIKKKDSDKGIVIRTAPRLLKEIVDIVWPIPWEERLVQVILLQKRVPWAGGGPEEKKISTFPRNNHLTPTNQRAGKIYDMGLCWVH